MSAATDAAKASLQGYQALGSDVALNNANQQYGVGESQTRLSALKGLVGNLQSSVEAVDPSVTGRTTGTFTTEGQRQALVSKEQAPILGNLSKQQGALTSEQGDLTQKQTLASQMASALISDDRQKYQRLLDQYNASAAEDAAAEQRRQAEVQLAEQRRQFDISAAQSASKIASSGGGSGGAQVNPAQDFLNYIADQFKAMGGAGNSKISRQTQDAWANAWFAQNGVSNANRQQYWNLYNQTYKRTDDPTKDWRYAK